jgi:chromosome segregation protein
MYLQKLEIQGFKSFAAKTVLEFPPRKREEKSITAIVGPNGSGKSNVSDAIRWVLGEQSLKLLRGKKSEDVIFSGSEKRARLGFAEVSLYLNNEDKSAPVDYEEVVITRRIYRSGEGEYLLNKNKVRLSDVVLLLAQANFGQKNYSIIGQGMVDAMLLASPAERKEFFDEATGVEQYQIKRDQAILKLKASQENLKQATILVEEIEPQVRFLRRQMKKLEERSKIEQELKDIQKKYYSCLSKDLNEKLEDRDKKVKPLLEKKEELEFAAKIIEEKLGMLEKEQPKSDSFRSLQKEYEKLFEEKNRLREKAMVIKNKIELNKQITISRPAVLSISEIQSKVEAFFNKYKIFLQNIFFAKEKNDILKIQEEAKNLKNDLKNLVDRFKAGEKPALSAPKVDPVLEKELNQISGEIEGINRSLTDVQIKIENFNKEQEVERKSFFDLQRSLQEKQHELYLLYSKINDIEVENAGLKAKREDLEKEIGQEFEGFSVEKEANNVVFDPNWSEHISKLKRQLELIGGIDPEVEKEYGETNSRYEFLKNQINDLEQAINSLLRVIKELDDVIKKQFDSAFRKINEEFGRYFKILFGGGKAQLILRREILGETENNEDEAELDDENDKKGKNDEVVGVEIEATPPGKKLKNINMLSGGERALASIALLSAIISNNPAPFIVLDEVDAALDESNSLRFANIFDELTEKTQFILITHNRATMQKATILYGVTMESDGVSRILSLKLEEAEKSANG